MKPVFTYKGKVVAMHAMQAFAAVPVQLHSFFSLL
jgi:hypothetical protein